MAGAMKHKKYMKRVRVRHGHKHLVGAGIKPHSTARIHYMHERPEPLTHHLQQKVDRKEKQRTYRTLRF